MIPGRHEQNVNIWIVGWVVVRYVPDDGFVERLLVHNQDLSLTGGHHYSNTKGVARHRGVVDLTRLGELSVRV